MNQIPRGDIDVDLGKERSEAFESIKSSLLTSVESSEMAQEKEEEISYAAQNEALDYSIRLDKINSRKKWDKWLLKLVIAGFILSYLMIVAIGLGWLSFDNSPFAVPSVVAAGVLETYGLAKIAARYFFSDDNRKGRK